MNIPASLEKLNKRTLVFTGFMLIGLIGIVDYLTGYEFAFSIFYIVPIFLITWVTNKQLGVWASVASAITWLIADKISGSVYSHPFIPIWNTIIRLAFFIIITLLLSSLKRSLQREKELARTDYLTSAVNSRYFHELAQTEISRIQRNQRPFTAAYFDLDNFKTMNDQFGHSMGDQALRMVVNSVRDSIRKTDIIARLGGDEFIILFPETDEEAAHAAVTKIQGVLMEEMRQNNWPITFSMGVLTCRVAPHTTDELVKMADELMYLAKSDGKNTAKYSTYTG